MEILEDIASSLTTTNVLLVVIALVLIIANWRKVYEVLAFIVLGVAVVVGVLYFFG